MTPRLLFALALATTGCITTTVAGPDTPAARAWLAENSDARMRISTNDGWPDDAAMQMAAVSPTQIVFYTKRQRTVPLENVRRLVALRHSRGALDGFLFGGGLAAGAGVLHGLLRDLRPSEQAADCRMICSHADAMKWEGLIFGVIGASVGAVFGAIVGHRDILELE
jgi:hypothetical protein